MASDVMASDVTSLAIWDHTATMIPSSVAWCHVVPVRDPGGGTTPSCPRWKDWKQPGVQWSVTILAGYLTWSREVDV